MSRLNSYGWDDFLCYENGKDQRYLFILSTVGVCIKRDVLQGLTEDTIYGNDEQKGWMGVSVNVTLAVYPVLREMTDDLKWNNIRPCLTPSLIINWFYDYLYFFLLSIVSCDVFIEVRDGSGSWVTGALTPDTLHTNDRNFRQDWCPLILSNWMDLPRFYCVMHGVIHMFLRHLLSYCTKCASHVSFDTWCNVLIHLEFTICWPWDVRWVIMSWDYAWW